MMKGYSYGDPPETSEARPVRFQSRAGAGLPNNSKIWRRPRPLVLGASKPKVLAVPCNEKTRGFRSRHLLRLRWRRSRRPLPLRLRCRQPLRLRRPPFEDLLGVFLSFSCRLPTNYLTSASASASQLSQTLVYEM